MLTASMCSRRIPYGRNADELGKGIRRQLARRAEAMSELTPKHVLVDLFGSGDFPPEILLDPAHAADVVIQRLLDAGFKIEAAGD
jgi:hypothetical protein